MRLITRKEQERTRQNSQADLFAKARAGRLKALSGRHIYTLTTTRDGVETTAHHFAAPPDLAQIAELLPPDCFIVSVTMRQPKARPQRPVAPRFDVAAE